MQRLICVGGLSSGCGKTSIVCLLLSALPGWAAVKLTPSRCDEVCPRGSECGACSPPDGGYEVTFDDRIPARAGSDTSRFAEAGASRVGFVRAIPDCLARALESTLAELAGAPGVIVESTTAMPLIKGLRLLVAREGWPEVKDSALIAAPHADMLIVNEDQSDARRVACHPPSLPEFHCRCVHVCPALPYDHAEKQRLCQINN